MPFTWRRSPADSEAAIGKLTGAGCMGGGDDGGDRRRYAVDRQSNRSAVRHRGGLRRSNNDSANVHTLATAAEQLAASVREMSVQATQSAKNRRQGDGDARQTDAIVQTLMSGTRKDRQGGDNRPRALPAETCRL